MTHMTDVTTTVDGYLSAWNERDTDGRLLRVTSFFGELPAVNGS